MDAARTWDPHRYRFTSLWRLPAPAEAVYAVLSRPDEYPLWWPQVREAQRFDDRCGLLRIRSVLPFELAVVARQARRDEVAGVLEAVLSGDLAGFSRWTVAERPGGSSTALFEEDVVVHHPLLRRFAVPGRPVFRLNHALMMRQGLAGLRSRLAG